FLISSYKHILKSNTKDGKIGAGLTPDERTRLVKNIKGYDISPDMVRLSLVNLYLHGFTDPHIDEYDALTSEDKWNEYADVVLANPPFMSPKGGIKPHKRFSVQSKRSEVLFVDYMAEHLTPNGRAAIIVPEGIIFQSQNAYKQLRKMLVEEYLFAVVSLPSGVFQPYSGVKTSILLMDKGLAKKSDSILFVKIENDGFDLGAQRRPNGKNDLPEAVHSIINYKLGIMNGDIFDTENNSNVLVVAKEKIENNGDWNLSGVRYWDNGELQISNYELVELGEICDNLDGKRIPITKSDRKHGLIPYYGASGIVDYVEDYIFDEDLLLISEDGANLRARVTPIAFSVSGKIWVNNHTHVLKFDNRVTQIFVEYYINSIDINNYVTGAAQPKLNQQSLNSIKIPLPPLEIQKEIVTEIEGYQKIIDGARTVVDNYKPHIQIEPEWEVVELGDVCEINPRKSQISHLDGDLQVSFVPMADVNENEMYFDTKETRKLDGVIKGYTYFQNDDVLLAKVTPCFENGKASLAKELTNGIGFGSSEFYVFRSSEKIKPEWIYYNVTANRFRNEGKLKMTGTGGLQRIPKDFVKHCKIPLPPLETRLFNFF
ncbi:MAG: restriction endonuclease subunit S, partial [Methanosarcinales archaeon]|nr:restriction endonuclease subunit S [Methanosarcinales archaeon]